MKTPYYLIDEKKLISNYQIAAKSFENYWPNLLIGYSFKTNPLPWIITRLKKEGAWAEVVSEDEYELAVHLGYSPDNIIFNGPVKGFEALRYALDYGSIVNLDNFTEIEWLKTNMPANKNKWKVGLRLNFDLENSCPGETVAGIEKSRFGFCLENGDAINALMILKKIPYVSVCGVHGHNSTKTRSINIFKTITKYLADFVSNLDHCDHIYIDIGGCLFGGHEYEEAFKNYPKMGEYAKTISEVLSSHNLTPDTCKLIIEPGAAITSTAISYYCTVVDIKKVRDVVFVTTDGSRLDISPHSKGDLDVKYNLNVREKCENRQIIVGYSCMEMDRIKSMPKGSPKLYSGDMITIDGIGSYGMSLAPLFIRYFKEVNVKYDNTKIVKVRESWKASEFIQKSSVYKSNS
jgi:diaminopimelate decarboxylase